MAVLNFLPWEIHSTPKNILGIIGIVLATGFFISPVPTFYRIIKKGKTGEFSSLPYVCALLQGLLWTFYGLPCVTPESILVTLDDGLSSAVEFVFIIIFIAYAPKHSRRWAVLQMIGCGMCFGAVVAVALLAFPPPTLNNNKQRQFFVGSIGAFFYALMFAAPLSVIGLVRRTKSVEFMPFWLSLLGFLTSTAWGAYGLYAKDPFLAVPSAIGSILGIVQLILYAMYSECSVVPVLGFDCGSKSGREDSISTNGSKKDDSKSKEFDVEAKGMYLEKE